MNSFDLPDISPVRASETLGMQDVSGLVAAHIKQRLQALCLTEIDQAFVIWAGITMAIFALVQFSQLSWRSQALIDALLVGGSIAATSGITWQLASLEKLRWVVFLWAGLMSVGMVTTAYGIFFNIIGILVALCPLWLGLCALGYGMMAAGMRSFAFTGACLTHVGGLWLLQEYPGSQFVIAGTIMSLVLLFFSVVPWDMNAAKSEVGC